MYYFGMEKNFKFRGFDFFALIIARVSQIFFYLPPPPLDIFTLQMVLTIYNTDNIRQLPPD